MSKQTLSGWDEDDTNIGVLLLSTNLDDYRLAYTLNKTCSTRFVNDSESSSASLTKKNCSTIQFFSPACSAISKSYLVLNQAFYKNTPAVSGSLFAKTDHVSLSLLKKFSKWPFFLVFSIDFSQTLLAQITSVRAITASQLVDFHAFSKREQNIIYNIYNEN